MGRLNMHVLYQYLVGINRSIAAQVFKIEPAFVPQCKFTDLSFKQVMVQVQTSYYRAEIFNVDIIKVHLLHWGIHQKVLVAKMEVVDSYLFKIDGPGFAFGFDGIWGAEKIGQKFKIAGTIFQFL